MHRLLWLDCKVLVYSGHAIKQSSHLSVGISEPKLDLIRDAELRLSSVLVHLSISVLWWATVLNLNGFMCRKRIRRAATTVLADIESLSQETA